MTITRNARPTGNALVTMMSSTVALDLLKRQKRALLRAIRAAPARDVALLDGILTLLDHIHASIEPCDAASHGQ